MEAPRNASVQKVLACSSSPDSEAQSYGIKLVVIGEGMLHKMYMPAPGSGISIDEAPHKIIDPQACPDPAHILKDNIG